MDTNAKGLSRAYAIGVAETLNYFFFDSLCDWAYISLKLFYMVILVNVKEMRHSRR